MQISFVTTGQVAQLAGVTSQTIRNYLRAGLIVADGKVSSGDGPPADVFSEGRLPDLLAEIQRINRGYVHLGTDDPALTNRVDPATPQTS